MNLNYLSGLLYLCDIFEIKDARGSICSLASGGKFIWEIGSYGDIHEQLLRNLIFMQANCDKEDLTPFWLYQFDNANYKYAAVAFAGLYKINRDKALTKLPEMIKVTMEAPDKYNLKLILWFFISEYKNDELFVLEIGKYLKKEADVVKKIVLAIVEKLGYPSQIIQELKNEIYCSAFRNFVSKIGKYLKKEADVVKK